MGRDLTSGRLPVAAVSADPVTGDAPGGVGGEAGCPAFLLPGDGRDVTPQATAANSLYPYREKALAALSTAALALALGGPLLGQLPSDGPADRVFRNI